MNDLCRQESKEHGPGFYRATAASPQHAISETSSRHFQVKSLVWSLFPYLTRRWNKEFGELRIMSRPLYVVASPNKDMGKRDY